MEKKVEKLDFKELIKYILIILFIVILRIFVITPIRVDGISMNDTLQNGEIMLLKKYDKSFDRFDIVVFNFKNVRLIKRVIGLPGEHVTFKNNKLYINDKEVKQDMITKETNDFDLSQLGIEVIPDGYYFVVGDNRGDSTDSRIIGLVSEKDILGTTNFVIFPFTKFGTVK